MKKKRVKILIVDDEAIIRQSLHDWLSSAGHQVLTAENGFQALEIIERESPSIVIADLVMPGMDGIELLKKVKKISPDIEVIIITAYGSIPSAVTAVREGAYDYIEKPFCPERVELLIEKLVEHQQLISENISLHQKLEERDRFEDAITKSPKVKQVIEAIKVVAKLTDLPQQTLVASRTNSAEKNLREVERNHIMSILAETQGNYTEAARILGISRMTLYNKAKVYGLNMKKIANKIAVN
jgi:DNA-binding NtrC family response regulator